MTATLRPPTPLTPTLAEQKSRKVRVLRKVTDGFLELQVMAYDGQKAITESRIPDQRADAHVAAADRAACRIAQRAYVNDDDPVMREILNDALLIRRHCAAYQIEDAAEDRLIEQGAGLLARIREVCRAMCRWLTKEGQKRGQS